MASHEDQQTLTSVVVNPTTSAQADWYLKIQDLTKPDEDDELLARFTRQELAGFAVAILRQLAEGKGSMVDGGRHPDEVLADIYGEQFPADPEKMHKLLWEIIDDVCSSYELALLPLIGDDLTGQVSNTVFDYLSSHYGDDSGELDDDGDDD